MLMNIRGGPPIGGPRGGPLAALGVGAMVWDRVRL
jgi:hypothetical protein